MESKIRALKRYIIWNEISRFPVGTKIYIFFFICVLDFCRVSSPLQTFIIIRLILAHVNTMISKLDEQLAIDVSLNATQTSTSGVQQKRSFGQFMHKYFLEGLFFLDL